MFNDLGPIVLNGTIASVKGWPDYTPYAGSKAALRAFARGWLNELKDRQIRVNVLSPGRFLRRSQMFDAATLRQFETPPGQNGRPEEIATVAWFLVVNGVELSVDGGTSVIWAAPGACLNPRL